MTRGITNIRIPCRKFPNSFGAQWYSLYDISKKDSEPPSTVTKIPYIYETLTLSYHIVEFGLVRYRSSVSFQMCDT